MIDVKTCRGANCDSDHYLVKAKIRQKITSSAKAKGDRQTKWDIEKLKSEEVLKEYQNKVTEVLAGVHNNEDMEKEWSNIESAITNATSYIIEKKQRRRNEDWFDLECADVLSARNMARKRLLQ